MGGLVLRLLLSGALVYTLVFLAFAVLPVDPARAVLGPAADPSAVEDLRMRYGLDRPILERFAQVALAQIQGDFGASVIWGQPVWDVLGPAMGRTLARLFVALGLGLAAAAMVSSYVVSRDVRGVRSFLMVVAGAPGFVSLILILSFLTDSFSAPPSTNPTLYEAVAVLWASVMTAAIVGLPLMERLDFRRNRTRQAEFLLFLHAPPDAVTGILMRGAWPTALAATANAATGALTVLAFAEYVFGLEGFAIPFFRACLSGDLAIVTFGSLMLAWCFLTLQTTVEAAARWMDRRLN
ncbi:peptide ABC transporter permease [Thalassobaculum fulvum]|uniref:Peptide ABC transporter permease n=1 Tax=Thalassobaculum fulvum TaxID=1633335 RepID=A0A918XW41_9PROT|nr:hypothetical protein [Thalassobaculum fulvum]GHD58491.1 peptide ABC transporter permease [Thalassobaculum fulvum]